MVRQSVQVNQEPIELVSSRPDEWAARFTQISDVACGLVPAGCVEHIGSTAVPGLPAKDVVDLMVGVEADALLRTSQILERAGFDLEGALPHHHWFSWPSRDLRQSVVHLVEHGSRSWTRRLAFRDLLRCDPNARRVYLEAKRSAAFASDGWADYTQAKAATVVALLGQD